MGSSCGLSVCVKDENNWTAAEINGLYFLKLDQYSKARDVQKNNTIIIKYFTLRSKKAHYVFN